MAEVSDGLIILVGYTYGSFDGAYTGEENKQGAAVMLSVDALAAPPTPAPTPAPMPPDKVAVETIIITSAAAIAALVLLIALGICLRRIRVNKYMQRAGQERFSSADVDDHDDHDDTAGPEVGGVEDGPEPPAGRERDGLDSPPNPVIVPVIGVPKPKAADDSQRSSSINASLTSTTTISRSDWRPLPRALARRGEAPGSIDASQDLETPAQEGKGGEAYGEAYGGGGKAPGADALEASSGVTSSTDGFSVCNPDAEPVPDSPLAGAGPCGQHGLAAPRRGPEAGLSRAVFKSAQGLLLGSTAPPVRKAAWLVSVLVQPEPEDEGCPGGGVWRARWCRSILDVLERAEGLLGKVRAPWRESRRGGGGR